MSFKKVRFDNVLYQFPQSMTEEEVRKVLGRIFKQKGGTLAADKKLKEDLYRHEGKRNWMYRDSLGFRTIGVGFNLDRKGGMAKLKKLLGVKQKEAEAIRDGRQALTDAQIDVLFADDLADARADAQALFPSYNQQPKEIQDVLVNMSFNMGRSTFSQFKKFKKAIESRDYNQANAQMTNSLWFKQVKGRGQELADIVLGFGKSSTAAITPTQNLADPITDDEIQAELDFLARQESQFTGKEETPEAALERQAALRKRLGLPDPIVSDTARQEPEVAEFDEDLFGPDTEPGFFQREDGSFFEITAAGEKIEHGQ